jgi:hypothetical protein
VPGSLDLFNSVSHALGYLLGDALAQAFAARRVSPAQVRELFSSSLEAPAVELERLRALIAPKNRQLASASG